MNIYSPIVNTDVAMPQEMLDGLTAHETFCIMSKINGVTVDHVKSFLSSHYGDELANQFKTEYLFSNPTL